MAGDIFDEILGDENAVDPATLIKQLRRERQLGQLGELSGDRVISPMGQRMQAGAIENATGLRNARRALQAQRDTSAYRDRTLDLQEASEKGRREDSAAQRSLMMSLHEMDNKARLEAARIRAQKMQGLSQAQQLVQQRFDQSQQAQLANRLSTSKLGDISAALKLASGVLDEYPEGEIPGVGGVENIRSGGIGTLATHIPGIGSGKAGRDVQAKLAPLQNIMLMIRSGAAVTDPELQRSLVEAGLTKFSTDEDLRKGLPNILKIYKQSVNNLLAGYHPRIVDEYRKRGGLKDIDFDAPGLGGGGGAGDVSDDQLEQMIQELANEPDDL